MMNRGRLRFRNEALGIIASPLTSHLSPLTSHLSPLAGADTPIRRTADPFPLGTAVYAHRRKVSAHQFDPGSPLRAWSLDPRYLTCPLIPVIPVLLDFEIVLVLRFFPVVVLLVQQSLLSCKNRERGRARGRGRLGDD